MRFNFFVIRKNILIVSGTGFIVLSLLLLGYLFYRPVSVQHWAKATKLQRLKGKIIILDPGHGGADPGAMVGRIKEADLNMRLAEILKKQLETEGATVKMTRDWDAGIVAQKRMKFSERARILNLRREFAYKEHGSMLISIHVNSNSDENVSGSCIYYADSASQELAEYIQDRLIDFDSSEKSKIEFGNFTMIRDNLMPSILIEAGFITNSHDLEMLNDKTDSLAKQIYLGICDYTMALKANKADDITVLERGKNLDRLPYTSGLFH